LTARSHIHVVCYALAIVPVAGDALNPALGYLIVVHQARKAKCVFHLFVISHVITFSSSTVLFLFLLNGRIPRALTRRMILNLAISTTIGVLPGLGAILVAAYRANVRNARLLENFLAARGERAGKAPQSANSEETRRGTTEDKDRERDKDNDVRQEKAGEMVEEKAGAARSTPDEEKEKGKAREMAEEKQAAASARSTPDGEKSKDTDGDEKDENMTGTVPDPDNGENGDHRRYLRPVRSTLEYVQNRDSRFIEDVS
jgi:Domain of unknown function (DUF4112)